MFDFTRIAAAVFSAAVACWMPGANAAAGDTYGPTGPNDTLWSIANRLRPEGATIEQTMLALTRINPNAFVGPQGNLVVAGATLRAPTLAEAQAVTAVRAARIVADPAVHWTEALRLPAIVENQDVAPSAGVEEQGVTPPAGLEEQGISSLTPPDVSPARPTDQEAASWQARAEDAESRVVELEQLRDDLQSQLDEQKAATASAERRIAQTARQPSLFRGRDAPSPMVLWGALGTAGFFLFIVGFVFGRRRGAKVVARGAGPKAQLGPRAMSGAATAIAADAPRADRMSSGMAGAPTQPTPAPVPRDPPAGMSPPAADGGGGMTTYASFSAGRLGEKAAAMDVGTDQGGARDARPQTAPLGADVGGGHDAGRSLGGAPDAVGLNEPDWQDRPTSVQAADAELEAPGGEGGDEGLTVAGDAQAPWVDRAAPYAADEPFQSAPQSALSEDATGGGMADPDWLETLRGTETADTRRVVPDTGLDDDGLADLDATREPRSSYPAATKLNLARAYADLSDYENARDVCREVIREGNDAERKEAEALLERLNEQTD